MRAQLPEFVLVALQVDSTQTAMAHGQIQRIRTQHGPSPFEGNPKLEPTNVEPKFYQFLGKTVDTHEAEKVRCVAGDSPFIGAGVRKMRLHLLRQLTYCTKGQLLRKASSQLLSC